MEWVSADVFDGAKPGDITLSNSSSSVATEAPAEQANASQVSASEATTTETQQATEVEVPQTVTQPEIKSEPVQQEASYQEPVQPKTWKEVLLESGFDEWSVKLLETKQAKGSVREYLEETAINYKELPSELILMRKIQDENPGISPKVLEYKLREELKRYPLDPDVYDEEQIAIGKEMLEMDVNRVRQTFIDRQKQYLEPEYVNPAQAQMQEIQRQQEAYRQSVLQNQYTQGLIQNKRLVLDGGKEKFNFDIEDPQSLVSMVTNPEDWQRMVTNPDGSPKIDVLLEAAAYVKYKNQIHQQLINYGKTLGEKKVIEEDLHNIPQSPSPTPGAVQKDLWETIRDQWK